MEVDKVADIVAKEIDVDINMEIQFGERVFDPKLYPPWASSKLCEFLTTSWHWTQF